MDIYYNFNDEDYDFEVENYDVLERIFDTKEKVIKALLENYKNQLEEEGEVYGDDLLRDLEAKGYRACLDLLADYVEFDSGFLEDLYDDAKNEFEEEAREECEDMGARKDMYGYNGVKRSDFC